MAKSEKEEEVSEDALLSEAGEVEASEDDLLREAQAATPASTGPTFYVRDDKGGFQPISKANADNAASMGLRVLSEAEVRGIRAAMPTDPTASPPPADPGFLKTVGRGLLQGFFKQGADEGAGAIARAGTAVGPNARYRMPNVIGPDGKERPGEMRTISNSGDVYRAVRDTEREVERGAREHHPFAAFLSNMAGDIASDAALSAVGVPVSSTPYQVASGALSGLLGSDAELSTETVQPRDAALATGSTALGAGLSYALPKLGTQVAKALPGTMASLRQAFENRALDKVKKVLTAGSGQLARRKPVTNEAAREALDSGAIPIWGTTQGAFERLKETAEIRGKTYADILAELEAAGVPGPQVEALAQRLAQEGAKRRATTGANKDIAKVFENEAENIRTLAPPAPNSFSLTGEGPMAVTGPRLTPEPRVASPPMAAPAPAPTSGPVHTPPLGPLPVRAAPVWTPAAAEATTAGRPRSMPGTAALPDAPVPLAPAATALREAIPGPKAANLHLSQSELIKRDLQDRAFFDKIQKTGLDKAKEKAASFYREAIEDAVEQAGSAAPPGSEVASLAERFMPTKRQLANTIAARDAAERGAGAAAHRVGGAAGVNFFDLANVKQATGAQGFPAMLLAGAGRIWKERGPSTLANVYDVGAEAAGDLSRAAYANPEMTQALSRAILGTSGRQVGGSSTVEEFLADYLRRRQAGSGN